MPDGIKGTADRLLWRGAGEALEGVIFSLISSYILKGAIKGPDGKDTGKIGWSLQPAAKREFFPHMLFREKDQAQYAIIWDNLSPAARVSLRRRLNSMCTADQRKDFAISTLEVVCGLDNDRRNYPSGIEHAMRLLERLAAMEDDTLWYRECSTNCFMFKANPDAITSYPMSWALRRLRIILRHLQTQAQQAQQHQLAQRINSPAAQFRTRSHARPRNPILRFFTR